tara:strand:+ start:4967 stop:5341 length:375 start_codon:yes stop_codon:yes gene_type:complete
MRFKKNTLCLILNNLKYIIAFKSLNMSTETRDDILLEEDNKGIFKKKLEKWIKIISTSFNIFTFEDFKNISGDVITRINERPVDCAIRELPNALDKFGKGIENRDNVVNYIVDICGVSPFQMKP